MSAVPDTVSPQTGLVARMADHYGLEPGKFLATVKATCFKTEKPISNEQLAALLVVCERYNLDPFAKHLYAFPDKGGGIVPVVSIDGWIWLVNRQALFDGMEFDFDEAAGAMTCTIWIKGRSHPVRVTEYITECRRGTEIWKTMPRRMIRHRSLVQCARIAFGLSGIYDEEEGEDIMRSGLPRTVSAPAPQPTNAERFTSMTQGNVIDDIEPRRSVSEPEHSDATPEPPTLASYMQQMNVAADPWVGEMILEEARGYLTGDEVGELAHAYARKFPNDPEETEHE